MLITRDILNKALEDKVPLFHYGDYIDNDVLYDLFYAPVQLKELPNGKKNLRTFISKDDRKILCEELKGHNSENPKEGLDKIYCNLKCESCKKEFLIPITRAQIINRAFKISNCIKIRYGNPGAMNNRCTSFYISFKELFKRKFGEADNLYVCTSCIDKFISDSNQEALEILKREDKFDWFRSEESAGDWRRRLFFEISDDMGIRINTINGDYWTDDKYKEWQKRQQQKQGEELNHQRRLTEIRHQQKVDEETEREKTKRENELFLARHQLNTPTQRYIDRFCSKDSYIDITDIENQKEALFPEGVRYEVVKKHNCTLYREYLQSPLWKIISSKVKWNAHNRCERCGAKSNLEVHHISYTFKGVEFLAFETLKCLCSKCHREEHEKGSVK